MILKQKIRKNRKHRPKALMECQSLLFVLNPVTEQTSIKVKQKLGSVATLMRNALLKSDSTRLSKSNCRFVKMFNRSLNLISPSNTCIYFNQIALYLHVLSKL